MSTYSGQHLVNNSICNPNINELYQMSEYNKQLNCSMRQQQVEPEVSESVTNNGQGDMNTQYLKEALTLIDMLQQNPRTLIQQNQVQTYVNYHYQFLKKNQIFLIIQGYEKLEGYIGKLLKGLQREQDSAFKYSPEEIEMQIHLIISILQNIQPDYISTRLQRSSYNHEFDQNYVGTLARYAGHRARRCVALFRPVLQRGTP